jgi:transposase-like protein
MEVHENTAINYKPYVFSPEDVFRGFNADFLDEGKCRVWIMWLLHRDETICPGCGSPIAERTLQSFWQCKRVRCDSCGKYFTALTDTFLSGCHFHFREIVLLSLLIALGVQDRQIATMLKISTENVRLWKLKFNGHR